MNGEEAEDGPPCTIEGKIPRNEDWRAIEKIGAEAKETVPAGKEATCGEEATCGS